MRYAEKLELFRRSSRHRRDRRFFIGLTLAQIAAGLLVILWLVVRRSSEGGQGILFPGMLPLSIAYWSLYSLAFYCVLYLIYLFGIPALLNERRLRVLCGPTEDAKPDSMRTA